VKFSFFSHSLGGILIDNENHPLDKLNRDILDELIELLLLNLIG
jgi:hypothetical protein